MDNYPPSDHRPEPEPSTLILQEAEKGLKYARALLKCVDSTRAELLYTEVKNCVTMVQWAHARHQLPVSAKVQNIMTQVSDIIEVYIESRKAMDVDVRMDHTDINVNSISASCRSIVISMPEYVEKDEKVESFVPEHKVQPKLKTLADYNNFYDMSVFADDDNDGNCDNTKDIKDTGDTKDTQDTKQLKPIMNVEQKILTYESDLKTLNSKIEAKTNEIQQMLATSTPFTKIFEADMDIYEWKKKAEMVECTLEWMKEKHTTFSSSSSLHH